MCGCIRADQVIFRVLLESQRSLGRGGEGSYIYLLDIMAAFSLDLFAEVKRKVEVEVASVGGHILCRVMCAGNREPAKYHCLVRVLKWSCGPAGICHPTRDGYVYVLELLLEDATSELKCMLHGSEGETFFEVKKAPARFRRRAIETAAVNRRIRGGSMIPLILSSEYGREYRISRYAWLCQTIEMCF